jgi:hypothetical protein
MSTKTKTRRKTHPHTHKQLPTTTLTKKYKDTGIHSNQVMNWKEKEYVFSFNCGSVEECILQLVLLWKNKMKALLLLLIVSEG